jgi:diaminopimelate decarboxylase
MIHPHIWPLTSAIDAQGRLTIAGCNVAGLAREHGTPLYLFDEQSIRSACRAYRTAFARAYPGETSVHYAGKALLNTALVQIVTSEGLGLDVVSGGELYVALRGGADPGQIHLHGNAKPQAELEQALAAGVGQIAVDNLDELALLARLTKGRPTPQPIALRLAPGVAPDTHHHIQTGQASSKFGLPLEALDAAAGCLLGAPGLRLVSLHAHLGSQIFEEQPYRDALAILLRCAAQLRDRHGLLVEEINPGGGLGVPYLAQQQLPDIERYAAAIAQAVQQGAAAHGLPLPRLAVEPGRSIVARAGVAVYTVVGSKPLAADPGEPYAARRYLHIDGGMGDNIRPSLYQARYSALLPERAAEPPAEVVHISGRYCESGDVLLRDLALPQAGPGDLLAVAAAGAYTLSMANNYNLTLRPAVLLLNAGRARLIQRRETYADLVQRDVVE